jgi:hypothetical protein
VCLTKKFLLLELLFKEIIECFNLKFRKTLINIANDITTDIIILIGEIPPKIGLNINMLKQMLNTARPIINGTPGSPIKYRNGVTRLSRIFCILLTIPALITLSSKA